MSMTMEMKMVVEMHLFFHNINSTLEDIWLNQIFRYDILRNLTIIQFNTFSSPHEPVTPVIATADNSSQQSRDVERDIATTHIMLNCSHV